MAVPILSLFLLFISIKSSANNITNTFIDCLNSFSEPTFPINGTIYTPDNSSFSSVFHAYIRNPVFYNSTRTKPSLIITPLHVSHIQAAVICAQLHGLQMRTRSGGHDYEGLSYLSYSNTPFFILDLFNLRSVDVNIEQETVWVQTGATLGEVYYGIAEKSNIHGLPGGVCPTVGVGGHCSGAGYGNMLRKYGLTADCIVDALLVDVNGAVLDRESMGEDLFWAITGGGGASFGVVLAFKFKLELPNQMITFSPFGGRMEEISEFAKPFPHRAGNLAMIEYETYWNELGTEAAKKNLEFARKMHEHMTPYVSDNPREAFYNYRDLDNGVNHHGKYSYEEGMVYGIRYFKEVNYNRLVMVKTMVDPNNFFSNEQGIPAFQSSDDM
ncbi:putative tetrahydroberberine oxidase [Helianthus annuus]|nr:putative tetrahydroberberine oxidase [Helianthus annuus]